MASGSKSATAHRQLVTYGRSSQKPKYGNGPQSSTIQMQAQTPDPWPENPTKISASVSQNTGTGANKRIEDKHAHQLPAALQTPRTAKPSRSTSLRPQTPSYLREDQSIYDIASSDDEQQRLKTEPWRKRRKIESPKIGWASKGFDDIISPSPKPATKHKHRPRHDSVAHSATTPTKSPVSVTQTGEIEVVIRTPKQPKVCHENMVKEGTMKSGDGLTLDLPRRTKGSTTANSQTWLSSHQGPHPLLSVPQSQPALRRPARKLARPGKRAQESIPKTLPLTRNQKPVTTHPFTVELEDDILEQDRIMNTTPSRRRIVDALSITPGGRSESPFELMGVVSRASSEISTGSSEDSTSSTSHDSQTDSPVPRQQPQGGGPKTTYARQRSILSVENATEDLILETPPQPAFAQRNVGGAERVLSTDVGSKNARSLAPRTAGVDDDDNSFNGVVRNIYELRRAGENARFDGIVDAIFEDIEDPGSSASRRYSGLIQLCIKLMDHQFMRRFLAHALENRLAKWAGAFSDTIYMYLIACAYGLILSTGSTSSVVLHTSSTQVFKVIPKMITEKSDILDISKIGATRTSKAVQGSLRDFYEQLIQSKIWPDVKPKKRSPQILALRCIDMAVRRARESGDAMEHLSDGVLSQLVDMLLQHSVLPEQIRDAQTDDLLILELALSILESYTVVLNSLDPNQEKILKKLSRLGPLLSQLPRYSEPCCRQVQLLEIRLILNLTNNNPSLCEDFSTPELINGLMGIVLSNFGLVSEDFASDKRDSFLDAVILALGTLINLTEWNETARQLILKTRSGPTTFLDKLLQLFKDGWEKTSEADSVVQTHSNVAFGYLSVLLSTVSLNDEARLQLRSSPHGRNIDCVLATVEEFLHYHRKVEKELQDGGGERESVSGFISRLQGIVDRIKQSEGIC
ncbi:hypothetical protein ACJ72_02176 [Emergomyces africanus]|uniref:Wings apart-like protein C-terminal domain-containing protein n=1 Tax=Emergomyces africanus TaxID=1955775 RepID=A0A1B7P391_9EURO|nr:hypothetical protein ACJ72_02176 [Emergomyces africanus]